MIISNGKKHRRKPKSKTPAPPIHASLEQATTFVRRAPAKDQLRIEGLRSAQPNSRVRQSSHHTKQQQATTKPQLSTLEQATAFVRRAPAKEMEEYGLVSDGLMLLWLAAVSIRCVVGRVDHCWEQNCEFLRSE